MLTSNDLDQQSRHKYEVLRFPCQRSLKSVSILSILLYYRCSFSHLAFDHVLLYKKIWLLSIRKYTQSVMKISAWSLVLYIPDRSQEQSFMPQPLHKMHIGETKNIGHNNYTSLFKLLTSGNHSNWIDQEKQLLTASNSTGIQCMYKI